MLKNLMMPYLYMNKDEGGSGDSDGSIDWSTVDVSTIPEDVIKKTSVFTKVKDEAATRRQENTKLKNQLQTLAKPEDDKEDVQDDPESDKANKNDSEEMPAWAKALQSSLDKLNSDRVSEWRKEAAEKYGIKSERAIASIAGSTREEIIADAKKLAEELGLPPVTQTTTPERNPNIVANPTLTRDTSFLEAVKAELRGGRGQRVNPFSPEVQRAVGGGVIMDE